MQATRRHLPVAALGLLLVLAAVGFFVVTTVRDNGLLRTGTRVSAEVLRPIPPGGWNLLDNGRIVVSYPTPAGRLTHTIWLDDVSDTAMAGSTVTVVYDSHNPGRVRTVADANDPVPWAVPVILGGLLGLILLIGGLIPLTRGHRDRRWARRHSETAAPVVRGQQLPDVRPHVPDDGSKAWDEPPTQAGWRHDRGRLARLAGATIVVAAMAVAAHLVVARHDAELLRDGTQTPGVVLDSGFGNGKFAQEWTNIRYLAGGVAVVGPLHGPGPGDLKPGSPLTVVFDARNPSRFRTMSYANHSNQVDGFVLTIPPVVAAILGAATFVTFRRLRRWRSILREGPWQEWTAHQLNRTATDLTGRTERGDVVRVTIRLTGGSRQTRLVPVPGPVLYRPGPGRRGLMRARLNGRPLEVTLPRSAAQQAGWLRRR
jgi:hypothetical protein